MIGLTESVAPDSVTHHPSMAAAILRVSPFLLSPHVARFARFRFKPRTSSRPISVSPLLCSSSSTPSTSSSPLQPPPAAASATAETLGPDSLSEPRAASPLQWVPRTALCGELGLEDVGKRVRLCGWVALHRAHGGLTFLNLRDSSGIVQVYLFPCRDKDVDAAYSCGRLRSSWTGRDAS